MPILSDKRIMLLARNTALGCIGVPGSDAETHCEEIFRIAVFETALTCAELCKEVGRTRLAEFHDAPRMADGCSEAILEAAK